MKDKFETALPEISPEKSNVRVGFTEYLPPLLFMLFDYIGIVLAEYEAFFVRNAADFWNRAYYVYPDVYIFIWVPFLFLIFLRHSRSYKQMKPVVDTMRDIFVSVFYAWMASIILIYFLKAGHQTSRLFIILFGISALMNVCVIRYAVLKFLKLKNIFSERVIVIGAGLTGERLVKFWREDLGYRYDIAGFIDDDPISEELAKKFPILGKFENKNRDYRRTGYRQKKIATTHLRYVAARKKYFVHSGFNRYAHVQRECFHSVQRKNFDVEREK